MQVHHHHDDAWAATAKIFWVWLCVGVSQMTPLQAVQFIAAIGATIFSLVQTWVLIRDKIVRDRGGAHEDRG